MKRFGTALILGILLFLLPCSLSITWEDSATTLTNTGGSFQTGFGEEQFSAFYYNGSFYIGLAHPHSASSYLNVGKYNSDLTTREDGWDTIDTSPYGSGFITRYNLTHGLVYTDIGQVNRKAYFFQLTDLTDIETWENTDTHLNSCGGTDGLDSGISAGPYGIIISRHLDCTEKYYYPNGSTAFDLYIPNTYDDDLHDLSLTYDFSMGEGNPSYFLFYIYGTGADRKGIYVSTYDGRALDSENYMQTQILRNSTGQSFNVSSLSSVFNLDNNAYYLSYLINDTYGYGNSNNQTDVKIIEYGLQDDNNLVELTSQTFDPPNVVDLTNYTASPYLFYVDNNDLNSFYMVYTIFNSSNDAFLGSFILKEDVPCECSDWVNNTNCVSNKIKQTRSCSPNNCAVETRYVNSTYCEIEINRTQGIYSQQTTAYYGQSSCETDWADVGSGVLTCYPNPIIINPDCQNIVTWIEAIPMFNTESDSGCSKGHYYLSTCNPTYDCFNQNYTCEQVNVSQTDYYYTYTAGETVTGKASLSVDNVCKCEWLFWDYGIKEFKLRASLNLQCDIPCQEEWTCINTEYNALKHIDCSITNTTYCQYGCSNGACNSLSDESSPYSTSSLWGNLFRPSKTTKFLYSLGGSIGIGMILLAVGHSFDKHNKNGGLFFMVGFGVGFAFFTLINWIPAVIIFIIIFFIGAYALFKHLK